MKLQDVQISEDDKKSVRINLKTYPEIHRWIEENDISPQKIFDEAIKELREQN